ncbi:aldo/keto reductase [Nocardioides ochotonae]|uniref:aldo/keto reductase n=1 Tax=Nocardioides ochotonae TaxID=2685869 RepID=UPI00140A63D7|nr:aldo/keto reductase [Nocardioides ochotonae]
MSVEVPQATLNTGTQMPVLGFGVFQIPPEETEQAVTAALAAGYRHIDTAAAYDNEEAVGRALAASGIAREELFITTKLWIQDAGEESAARAFDASLQRLGLDHLDLYLIHQPYGDYYGAWRTMRRLVEDGVLKAAGVSNFHADRLVDLAERSGFVPAVNQIETHPYYQRQGAHDVMVERGIQHEAWGGFAEGRNGLFTDPALTAIGAAHEKSVAQVVLRWLFQRDIVSIPKSTKPERMAENIDIFDFALTDAEMDRITGLDTGSSLFFDHRDPAMASRLGGVRIHD